MTKKKIKNIVGFMGDGIFCKNSAEVLQGMGFYKISIGKKVLEISKYLIEANGGEITEDILNQIRNRGYKINRLYWINLALSSVPDDKKKIVIEDLRIEDIIKDVISPYYISNGKKDDCPPDIEIIEKTKEISDFKKIIESKFKS